MARNFLGNLKGPQGPKGDTGPKGEKGDTGEFKDTAIGVNNLLDLGNLETYDLSSKIDSVDIENGIVRYSNLAYYMRNTKILRKGVHTFRIKDYTGYTDIFGGKLRFQVRAVGDSTNLLSVDVGRGETHSFNVIEEKEYYLELRPTGVDRKAGFIEKPMLVEGDYSVLWNPCRPVKDYSEYRMFESKIPPNVETQLRPYHLGGDLLGNVDSELVLTTGVWLINWNFYINNQNGDVRLRLYKDGELIADKLTSDGYENLSRLISVESGSSQLRFTVQNMGDNELTMSTAIRNNMQLKKL